MALPDPALLPILMVGDSPTLPTGLGRIMRDLCNHLWHYKEQLGIDLGVLGWKWDGMPQPWPVWSLDHFENWGQADFPKAWAWHSRGRRGVVMTVWDPSRCHSLIYAPAPPPKSPYERWGYFAIDGHSAGNVICGPGAETVQNYHRVLAYTEYGAKILDKTIKQAEEPLPKEVGWLPHGIDPMWFEQPKEPPPTGVVGCVAANQPRKNLGLLFEIFNLLRARDSEQVFWLHTDQHFTEAWSIPDLADLYGVNDNGLICTKGVMSDENLREFYRKCRVTVAPSSGEGFGYPIVESLASGVPVVHGAYGGGAEIVPNPAWRVAPIAQQVGTACIDRPVFRAEDFVKAIHRTEGDWGGYCRGSVKHLAWPELWPKWMAWFKTGLDRVREADNETSGAVGGASTSTQADLR